MIMNFPSKLKQLRLKNNLSQQKLADMIFVSRTLINKYENGAVIPTKENLEKLANCLNVSIDELFSNEDTLDVVLKHSSKKQNVHFSSPMDSLIYHVTFNVLFYFFRDFQKFFFFIR